MTPLSMLKPLSQKSMFDFFLRRFFPFFLIVPLVFFLIFQGQGRGFFWNINTIIFFYLPLGVSILLTLIYFYEGQTDIFQYGFAQNWRYTLKRFLTLVSLIYLVLWFFPVEMPFWFHLLGTTVVNLTVILLCSTLIVSWGIVIRPQSQCFVFRFLFVIFCFFSVINGVTLWRTFHV